MTCNSSVKARWSSECVYQGATVPCFFKQKEHK